MVAEAVTQVDSRGMEHLSLRAVASSVGVSPSAAYHHFADKDALLFEVGVRSMEMTLQSIEEAVDSVELPGLTGAIERVRAGAMAYIDFALSHPHLFQAGFSGLESPASVPIADATCDAAGPGMLIHQAVAARTNGNRDGRIAVLPRLLDELVSVNAITPAARADAESVFKATLHGLAALMLIGWIDPNTAIQQIDKLLQLIGVIE